MKEKCQITKTYEEFVNVVVCVLTDFISLGTCRKKKSDREKKKFICERVREKKKVRDVKQKEEEVWTSAVIKKWLFVVKRSNGVYVTELLYFLV